mmetsp:Transcript_119717/g.298595  ORF Transcript_119717/g.298595 Transcript_119717/m.298595 type:complete len:684 (+) Transcript_119717:51-2102(+)
MAQGCFLLAAPTQAQDPLLAGELGERRPALLANPRRPTANHLVGTTTLKARQLGAPRSGVAAGVALVAVAASISPKSSRRGIRRGRRVAMRQAPPRIVTGFSSTALHHNVETMPAAVTLHVKNMLDVPLCIDGSWLKTGDGLSGSALRAEGIPGGGVAEIILHGSAIEALIWFRASDWPFTYVTVAVRREEEDSQVRLLGEASRALPLDGRKFFQRIVPFNSADPATLNGGSGIMWGGLDAGGHGRSNQVLLTVLADSSMALVPRGAFDAETSSRHWDLPSLDKLADWVMKISVRPGLQQQLEEACKGSQASTHVADRYLFDLLGVTPGASPQVVRAAWRQLAREVHPDVATGDENVRFDDVREAFRVLSDPELRARYEALGFAGLDMAHDEQAGSLAGLAAALALLLGAWAMSPLLGGPLLPPLGLASAYASSASRGEDPIAELRAGASSTLHMALGLSRGPDAEAKEAVTEIRAALATRERVEQHVEGRDSEGAMQALRSEVRGFLEAGQGTLAPHLLARWGRAHSQVAQAWLRREAPQHNSGREAKNFRLPSSPSDRAACAVGILGAAAASIAALPGAALAAILGHGGAPGEGGSGASQEVVIRLVDVVYRTAVLEVETRGAAAAQRMLEDEAEPWQLRWRAAHALSTFGDVLVQEGDLGEPDLAAFVCGNPGDAAIAKS